MIEATAAPAVRSRRVPWTAHPVLVRYLYPTLTFVALLALWELAIAVFRVPDYIIPPPTQIVGEMIRQFPQLWGHTLVTSSEVLAGFALSVLIGIPLAVLIVYSPFFERTVYPLL